MADDPDANLHAYLAGLDREQLERRLLAIAARDEAALTALRAEAAAAAGGIDVAGLRKSLTAQLRVSGFIDWRGSRSYAERVDGVLDLLEHLIAGGCAAEVVVLAEHVIARLDTALGRIDDSGGWLGPVADRAQALHLAACTAVRPDPRKLAVRLADLALKSDWDWFLEAPERYAEVLGSEGLDAYGRRIEQEWAAVPVRTPTSARALLWDGSGVTVSALRESLARAGGSCDELVEVLSRDLGYPQRFVLVADALEQAGREREAVAWLERGCAAFPPAGDAQLRSRLVRAYLRDGLADEALGLVERAFEAKPLAATYAELRAVAADRPGWPERRAAALDRMRNPRRGVPGQHWERGEVVEAQLAEGDIDGALADARAGGCGHRQWLQLAELLGPTRPDEAGAIYRSLVDQVLTRADVSAYRDAVRLLGALGAMLAVHGRAAELAADVERIRAEHYRRSRLLKMLAAAGW